MNEVKFVEFLRQHDDDAWGEVVSNLLPDVHAVDRNALKIWFSFFPVKLYRALAENEEKAVRDLILIGKYKLADQVDSSHWFLFGHRYWEQAKQVVMADAKNPPRTSLEQHIRQAARQMKAEPETVLGIVAVAYATLQQVGWEVFSKPVRKSDVPGDRSPEAIVNERSKPEPRSFLASLLQSPVNYDYTIRFDENDPKKKFKALTGQALSVAGAEMPNAADFRAKDPRCVTGPIPVECQTGACGTCWVGVLGGEENLNEITNFEKTRLEKIGYSTDPVKHPVIRLGCKALCHGPASIVIPPWSGVLANLEKFDLEKAVEKAKAVQG